MVRSCDRHNQNQNTKVVKAKTHKKQSDTTTILANLAFYNNIMTGGGDASTNGTLTVVPTADAGDDTNIIDAEPIAENDIDGNATEVTEGDNGNAIAGGGDGGDKEDPADGQEMKEGDEEEENEVVSHRTKFADSNKPNTHFCFQ